MATSSSQHSEYVMRNVPRGVLVAVGGNEDKLNDLKVLRRIVKLVDGGNPTIEVITTASSMPEELGEQYRRAFEEIGATSIRLMHIKTRPEADTPEYLERIREANIVFFTGGDQLRITSILGGSPILQEVRRKYFHEKCVIAGTSAGATAMPDTMIYEGESGEALAKGSVQMTGGIGLVKRVVIDSHFIKRGRFSRLMEIVTTNPGYVGVGLGEDTGVIIRDGHILEAIGHGLVVIFDGQHIKYTNVSEIELKHAIAVENVIVHTIVKGHGYDLLAHNYLRPSDSNG